jgi:nucleoside-diphosphate-sugar epimerase
MATNDAISVFGSTGFIGSRFVDLCPRQTIEIPRESREPQSNDILYFISTVHNYNIFDDPYLDIDTNLNLLIEVLEKCKGKEDITFNFISSWFVYGKTNDLPAKESSCCNPKGFYSITKRAAEQLLVSYCETVNIN